jgi:lysozyme
VKTSAAGIEFLKHHEGLRLHAYRDVKGVWTIGYGHTGDVHEGRVITAHQAEALLEVDLDRVERDIETLFPGANQNQFDALVSLGFNVGTKSTPDRPGLPESRLRHKFLASDHRGAADEFPHWCHAGGEVIQDLVHRRADERQLFLTPVVQQAA